MVKIKICGITNLEDALACAELGVHAIGFIFAQSPRLVLPKTAKEICTKLPPFIIRVGVFVNSDIKSINDISDFCRLDMVQLHGAEAPEYCPKIKKRVIKAFRIKDENSLKLIPSFQADAYLLDTYVGGIMGGTGQTFDWSLAVKAKDFGRPIILSGGLNPQNVREAIKTVKPYAVDVGSGVESSPGKKDLNIVKKLIEAVRTTSQEIF